MNNSKKVQDEAILAYIRKYVMKKGYGPSIREVMSGVGFKTTSVTAGRVHQLRERGLLVPAPKGSSRTIFPAKL